MRSLKRGLRQMYKLLTVEQIRELERRAIEEQGRTAADLMNGAGLALADTVVALFDSLVKRPHLRNPRSTGKIVICAGPGNNGGDGWTAASQLHKRGVRASVLSLVDINELSGITSDAAFEAVRVGVHWELIDEHVAQEDIEKLLDGADIVVDALLGIGAHLPLSEHIARVTDAINSCGASILAADVPTGIDADNGAADEHAVQANRTVTFLAAKKGMTLSPAFSHTGAVAVDPLDIDESAFADFLGAPELYSEEELAADVPLPALEANKYSRGRALIIAGSRQYPGAAILSAQGATHCGAGYATVACPESLVSILQSRLITSPVVGLAETREGTLSERALDMMLDLASMADAILIGPGLDRNPKTAQVVRAFVEAVGDKPLVIDADALNAFIDHTEILTHHDGPLVLTPHAGELSRLLGVEAGDITQEPFEYGRKLAGERRSVVLKGPITVISCAERQSIDMFGPPVLATAGTGDVLAGMITALACQGVDAYRAASIAVRLHGMAGVAAMEAMTPLCVTATEVVDFIAAGARELLHWDRGEQ